jgi:KipI family sensor histidine kinase inhibitor
MPWQVDLSRKVNTEQCVFLGKLVNSMPRQPAPLSSILPLSDTSVRLSLGEHLDPATNRRVHLLAAALALDPLPGVSETVPGYASLVVHYDPLTLTHAQVAEWLGAHQASAASAAARPARRVEVPVQYGGENGLDLDFVAAHCHLTVAEVIRLHSSNPYLVYMMGFTPGFAYLGKLPDALVTPRLETPRTLVRAGTVAIAGAQTGIYPLASPGGWRLLGHTTLLPFDPRRNPPFLFAPGDEVRFVAV